MKHKFVIFLIQCVILLQVCKFVHSKAFIGSGNKKVKEGEFPTIVCIKKEITVNNETSRQGIKCTGTLITRSHILTAAHCYEDLTESNILAIYGAVDVRAGFKLVPIWWITFQQWATNMGMDIVHPTNDISTLKISEPVSDTIIPTPLYPSTNDRLVGLDAVIVGCGFLEVKPFPTNIEKMKVKILSLKECERRMNDIMNVYKRIPTKDLCSAREPYGLVSAGDSGGPLLHRNYIVGVTLGTHPKLYGHPHPKQFNYHTGIDFYRHFINSMIAM